MTLPSNESENDVHVATIQLSITAVVKKTPGSKVLYPTPTNQPDTPQIDK